MPASVKGGIELRKALREFTPDLAKGLTKEVAAALKPVVKVARSYMPNESQALSNWGLTGKSINARSSVFSNATFPAYAPSVVKSSIGFKSTPSKKSPQGFRSLAQLYNKDRAGAIYELAGTKNPDRVFVKNMEGKFPSQIKGRGSRTGRGLYRAYEEDNGKALSGVLKAIENAKDNLNKRATVRG